jgi:hypothetical protein
MASATEAAARSWRGKGMAVLYQDKREGKHKAITTKKRGKKSRRADLIRAAEGGRVE